MLRKIGILGALLALACGLAHAGANQVSLALEFERIEPVMSGISHVQRSEKQLLLDLDKKTMVTLDNGWVIELTGKDSSNAVDLALTIRDSAQAAAKVVAQPRVLAKLGETSKVSWTRGEEKMSLAIKPAKPAGQ
ncbi:hypothetical protein [Duganella qianjiadongensis]|uniref:Copper-binding protein n=1 Tax=Duganella qianjiadongensis TaxID=2692176 RepID=A0ABW9VIT6_9BURK|nr:hypothetical protein [Duganella qianjiadongensis]MYM39401.1 hypothetical protein [Duganella qianjiadongensis]